MSELICLDEQYSTTRMLTKKLPDTNSDENSRTKTVLSYPIGNGRQGKGGLRHKGYFKSGAHNKPLITVVTVVFNGAEFLEETIKSIINQTYSNVEYIIIDGGSTDGTLDIILKYEHAIDYWVSENDSGIYDAMNKAIVLASGGWINFMNCGDQFYSSSTLDLVFSDEKYIGFDIIFGNHEVSYASGRKRMAKAGNIKNLWKGSQFCHQASFVESDYHKSHPFNPYAKIIADFEFYYLAWKANARFKYTSEVICSIAAGGVSDIRRVDSILGRWLVVDKDVSLNFFYIILLIKEIFKSFMKKHLHRKYI